MASPGPQQPTANAPSIAGTIVVTLPYHATIPEPTHSIWDVIKHLTRHSLDEGGVNHDSGDSSGGSRGGVSRGGGGGSRGGNGDSGGGGATTTTRLPQENSAQGRQPDALEVCE